MGGLDCARPFVRLAFRGSFPAADGSFWGSFRLSPLCVGGVALLLGLVVLAWPLWLCWAWISRAPDSRGLQPDEGRLLPTTYYLPPTTYYLLPTTYYYYYYYYNYCYYYYYYYYD